MSRIILVFITSAILSNFVNAKPQEVSRSYPFSFVSRSEWGARPSGPVTPLRLPVPNVVIHHSYSPGVCMSKSACITAMRSMQNYHQNTQGWADIGYNFAVGGEGSVLEGRGWQTVGAHAVSYNAVSIGICLIGDWTTNLPPAAQLEATKKLIEVGVNLGYISRNYRLMGHRQATPTECPGDRLFREISTWNGFTRKL